MHHGPDASDPRTAPERPRQTPGAACRYRSLTARRAPEFTRGPAGPAAADPAASDRSTATESIDVRTLTRIRRPGTGTSRRSS
jgi:hypothetical protein